MDTQNSQLDAEAVNLAKAIRQTETGGNFNAQGKSGEWGGYQFTKPTWQKLNQKYGTNYQFGSATPEQQNELAYKQIKDWKDQGYNVGQVASMWNAGESKPNAYQENYQGINAKGVKFNTPAYAKSVATAYQQLKAGQEVGIDPNNPSSTTGTQMTEKPNPYGATFRAGDNTGNTGNPIIDIGQGVVTDIGKMAGNIPSSALNLGKNLANAVVHPIKTAEAIGNTAVGGLERGAGAITGKQVNTDQTKTFDAVIGQLRDRYGSVEGLRKTAIEDPVGLALDIATALEGVGGAVKGASLAGQAGDIADLTEGMTGAEKSAFVSDLAKEGALGKGAEVGSQIGEAGSKINPMNIALKGVSKIGETAGNAIDKFQEGMQGGIFKPTPSQLAKNPNLLSDMANEGLFAFTKRGLEGKIYSGLREIGSSIDEAVGSASGEISTQDLIKPLEELKATYANIPGEASSVKTVDGIIQDTLAKGDTISLQDAQQLKMDMYDNLPKGSFMRKMLENPASAEAQRQLARSLRVELEKQIPELGDLNKKYAIYKAAKDVIGNTIKRASGKGIAGSGVGLYDLMTAMTGGTFGGFSGALKALAGEKLITSTAVLSGVSKLLNLFDKVSIPERLALWQTILSETANKMPKSALQPTQ